MRRLLITLTSALALLASVAFAPPVNAQAQPAILSTTWVPGDTIDKANGPLVIGAEATADTVGVLVAIKDNNTGKWWHQATCGAVQLGCKTGSFENGWRRYDSVISNVGGNVVSEFPADLPPGNYNIGIRPVAANGNVAPGPWYQVTVVNTAPPLWRAGGTPLQGETVKQGLVTISSGHPFGSPAFGPGPGSAQVAIKRLNDNKWMQADGSYGPTFYIENMPIVAFGAWSFLGQKKVELAPGNYGYWVVHYDEDGVKASQGWTSFKVKPCSRNCGNVTATGAFSGIVESPVCMGATSDTYRDGGTVRMSIKNDDTGLWLQNEGLYNGNPQWGSWTTFNNLSQIIQGDWDSGFSCYYDDPVPLEPGNYHMGMKAIDSSGEVGSVIWSSFTVVE